MVKQLTIYIFVGILSIGMHQGVRANNALDSILSINNNSYKVQALVDLAFETRIDKKQGSKEIIALADSIAKQNKLPYLSALTSVLHFNYNALTLDTSRFYCLTDSLKNVIKPYDDPRLNGEFNLALGNYYNFSNNADKSILSYLKGIEYFLQVQDSVKLAHSYNSIGIQYLKLNNNEVAMTFLLYGYNFLKKDGEGQLTLSLLNNIGLVYYRLQDYNKALEYYTRALNIMEKNTKQLGIIILYNNIADIYIAQKAYDKAKAFLYKAYKESELFNSEIDLVFQSHSFGNFYTTINMLDSADFYFDKSMKGFEKLNYSYSLNRGYYDVSLLYFKQKKHNKAIKHLNKAATFFKEFNNYEEYKNVLYQISLNFEHLNNYKKALKYSKLANNFSDTILQVRNVDYLAYLDSKIDLNREVDKFKQEVIEKNNRHKLEVEKHKRKNVLYIYSSLVFALILMFIALINYRTKRNNKILNQKNKDILKKNSLVEIAHSELMEQYSFNKTLLDTIPYPVFYTDKNRYFLGCNSAFEEATGLKADELVDVNILELNIKTELICDIPSVFGEKDLEFQKHEGVIKYADNKLHDVICFQKTIVKDNNNTAGNLGIIVDITDVKEAERKLKLSENELKNNLKDREKFIRIMAHDLKNPFSSVLGITELLKDNYDAFPKDKTKELIESVHESSNNIYRLLENLLEWTKSQSGSTELNKTVFAIDETIDLSLSLFKDQIRNKNLQIKVSDNKELFVSADKNMVQTIIRNLVSNAIKFTPENGSVSILVKPNSNKLNVKISDTGVGIPRYNLEQLFNPHKSISTPGLNNEKGTGLGLIICQEFAHKHGAELRVKSELDKGTIFEFDLPLASN